MKKIYILLLIIAAINGTTNIGPWQNGGTDIGAWQDAGSSETPPPLCTLTIATDDGGTVNPSGAQSDTCGDLLSIEATASDGYRFLRWLRSGTTATITDSADATTTVRRNDSAAGTVTITADFIPLYTLDTNAENGTISVAPFAATYDSNTTVNLEAIPALCYGLDMWSGDLSGSTNPTTITMDGNKTVTANFTENDSLTITSSAGLNGSISPNGAVKYKCGTNQTYTITPNPGYTVDDVLVDGGSEGAIEEYTFTSITENHTIEASFRAQPSNLHNINSASILNDSTGSTIQIVVDSIDSASAYNYGFTAWNTPTVATPTITIKTPGFDSTGAPVWITKTGYLTHTMRKTYPAHESDSSEQDGDDFKINVWLSHLITNKDTVRLNVPKGWFISTTDTSDVCSNLLVTNNSAVPPNKEIGNWSKRNDYTRVTDSIDLRCHVFHRSADSGKLVRAVKFTVSDDHGDTVTTWARTPSRTITDVTGLCIIEYRAMVPVASFTALDTLICNFMAFPREGDSAACINTATGTGLANSPSPLYFLCDKENTYGVTVAVVGDTTGQGGAGAAIDAGSFDSENPPNMYNRIYLAVNAISAYNNTNHSRNNASAGTVYLQAGTYSYSGGTITTGTRNNFAHLTIMPFPGVAREDVIIDTGINTKAAQLKVTFKGVTINKNKAGSMFDGHRNLVFDSCELKGDSTAAFVQDTTMIFNKCLIRSFGSGLYPYTGKANVVLVRDCIFRGFKQKTYPFMMIGCKRDSLVANTEIFITSDLLVPNTCDTLDNFTIAYNDLKYMSSATKKSIDLGNTMQWHVGGAIIQNLIESVDSVPATYMGLCDGSAAGINNNRLNLVHNTLPRARSNTAYNDAGTAVHWRAQWFMYGNTWAKLACKQDQFAPASGNRVGGWGVLNGAGMECNLWPEIKDQPGTITFLLEFSGINSFQESTTANAVSYYNWLDDKSHTYTGDSLSAGSGGGDYHPTDSSPVIARSKRLVLPYDLYGDVRYFDGALGAAEYPSQHYVYVRDGGTGDGSDWTNALDDLPATIDRGDTVLVADGNYATYEFNDAADGTKYVTIRKATASNHGTVVGWQDSYGDGQAVFATRIYVNAPYLVFDGVTGGGPDAWADSAGYGFKINYTGASASQKLFQIASDNDNIKLRHTMLIYSANSDETDSTTAESQDTYYCLGSDSSEVSYCSFWHAGRCHMLTRNFDNALIEHNYFHRNKTCLRQHAQSIDDHGGSDNWTLRYNVFRKNMGTGVVVVLDDGAENCDTSNYWKIYGNIFWGGERGAEFYDVSDGPIVVINDKFANGWKIYNNTFINIDGVGTLGNRFFESQCTTCGHEIRNNLWVGIPDSITWGWSTGDVNSAITHEYFETGTRHKSVTSEQIASDTIPNYATYDFDLSTGTTAGYTLDAPYNVDLYGNTRGADGTWDRGALEYESGPVSQFTLTIIEGDHGTTVPTNGDTLVDSSGVVLISCTPDFGYIFEWVVSGALVLNEDSTEVEVNGNGSLSLNYTDTVCHPTFSYDSTNVHYKLDSAINDLIATPDTCDIDSFYVTSGTLPTGLSLNASTGAITGTPTAAGTFPVTITAYNNGGASTATAELTFVVASTSRRRASGWGWNGLGIWIRP